MEAEADSDPDSAIHAQLILLAASHHDTESLHTLLRTGGVSSASVQDPESGSTPLHAAIAACHSPTRSKEARVTQANGVDHNNGDSDGKEDGGEGESELEQAGVKTVKLLLQNGAIWNDVNQNDETPGCIARRLGLTQLYNIMVDAGVRAEILLSRLDEYERLKDEDSEDEEEKLESDAALQNQGSTAEPDTAAQSEQHPQLALEQEVAAPKDEDLLNPNPSTYLRSSLIFHPSHILDASSNGVMMSWETPLMHRTAFLLCSSRPNLRILNIGHGMGIIDSFFQSHSPSTHHIIEAHPSVLAQMRQQGWYDKPNVTIHEGKWQDICPRLIEDGTMMFDVIYFDTFAEEYSALRTFFSDLVIGLLDDEGGKWGFFNGLGADRQICYDVYAKVVEMDLFEAGFDVEWEDVQVPELEREGASSWDGVRRKYWVCDKYRLPICRFAG
ncbi:MAG: hypothetical protein Q9190_007981 [Brigantiaea leucoxantha]